MATIEDKIQRIIEKLELYTSLRNLVPGSTIHSLVESCAFETMKLESAQEMIQAKSSISTAIAGDLDEIGETIFGIPRRASIPPTITSDMKLLKLYVDSGTFGGINSGKDITVQSGTILEGATSVGYLKFATREVITLPLGSAEMYIDADLVLGPYEIIPGNSIVQHNITTYSDVANKTLKVTNVGVVATGRPRESDDNYRFRIATALKSFPKTNYFGIHEELTGIPGVSDVTITPANNGAGTFTVFVNSITPQVSAKVLNDVKLSVYQCVPPWVSFTVTGPSYVGLKLNIQISLYDPSVTQAAKQAITEAISVFVNNVPSRSFSIKELETIARSADVNVLTASISTASVFRGEIFREATDIDLTNISSYSFFIDTGEKLIVEPTSNAITVSVI